MGLGRVLNSAMSGLRVAQAGIDTTAQNVANAGAAGYTRRVTNVEQDVAGGRTVGARVASVDRILDRMLQRQLRLETAGAGYTATMAQYRGSLDAMFGPPGGAGSLDGIVNGFTKGLQALASDPGSIIARRGAIEGAGVLASTLTGLSSDVQGLRNDAEGAIGDAVGRVNELLSRIERANAAVVRAGEAADPALHDERDQAIDELSRLMDVRTSGAANGGVTLFTSAGLQLFDGAKAAQLGFDERTGIGPQSLWSANPTSRGVGTITLQTGGSPIDLIASGAFRSGEIAALIELRDETLVEAQTQLDALAEGLANAADDPQSVGVRAGGAPPGTLDVDLTGFGEGDSFSFDYVEGGVAKRVTVLVVDPSRLPLPNAATDDPNDRVLGVSTASTAAIQSAFTAGSVPLGVASSGPASMRVTPTAAGAPSAADALVTVTRPFALFEDAAKGRPAPDSLDVAGRRGFAARIGVAAEVVRNPALLVVSGAGVAQGDSGRPSRLVEQLTKSARAFGPDTGINGGQPYLAPVTDFARRIVEAQGSRAESAFRLDEGQTVALRAVESRYDESSAVNVDRELANLVQLQTAYAANARVISAVRDLMDTLLRL